MSEQAIDAASTRARTPIHWTSVTFIHTSHRKLTGDPALTNSLLALLAQHQLAPP